MEEQQNVQSKQHFPDRPSGFGILLMLSGISSLFGIFSNFVWLLLTSGNLGISTDELLEKIKESMEMLGLNDDSTTNQLNEMMILYGPQLSTFGLISSFLTMFAVVQMFRFKKIGFHFYVSARIIEVFAPVVVVGAIMFNTVLVFICGLFIFFYSRYLKLMH